MSPKSPKESVEASKDRFTRIEELVKRGSRIQGQVEAVEQQISHEDDALPAEIQDTLAVACDTIRSDATTLQDTASEFLSFEADSRALVSIVAVFTSDLSEVEEYHPEGDLSRDIEPFANRFDDLCDLLELEVELIQAVIALKIDGGETSFDLENTKDMSIDSLLSRIEEVQSERQSGLSKLNEHGEFSEFELTQTAVFE